MFFGYTNCPDFCPTTLATLAAMEKRLRAEQRAVRPRVMFVSVDAKRDTPAAARQVRALFRSRVHRRHRGGSADHRGPGAQARRRA